MADGKNIEIKIAATGGDQAAAEVRKLETAAEGVSTGFGGMLDKLPERTSTVEKSVQDLDKVVEDLIDNLGKGATESKDAGKALDDMGEDAEDAAKKLDKVVAIQRAQVANEIAKGLAQIGEHVKKASKDFAESDPEFSKTLNGISEGVDAASGALSGAAQGFAVGGPFGAAIGALVGGGLVVAKSAFDDMTQSILGASEAEARAVEMKENLTKAQESFNAVVLTDEITDQYDRQTEALKKLLDELDTARKITAAEDKIATAKRDNEDAEAIRNGAPKEDVKAKRSQDDAARAKARVDYEVENEKKIMLERQKVAADAAAGVDRLKADGGATSDQIKRAEEILKKAQEAAAAAERKFTEKSTLAPLEKEAIDSRADGKVDALAGDKAARLAKEKDAEDRKAAAKAAKDAREDAREEAKKRSESRQDAAEAGREGRAAEALLPKGVSAAFRKSFQKVSDGLQDGDQGGELEKLLAMMESLEAAVARKGDKSLARRIDILEQRIRNNGK